MFSLLELAAEPGSTSRSHLLPAKMMSNLAQLSVVCFQYCTTHGSCTEGFSGDSSTSKRLLFDAVEQLLLTEPEIIKDILSLLLKLVSGKGERVIREQVGNFEKLDSLKRHILHSLDRTQLIYTCILWSFSQSLVIHDCRTEVQKIHESLVFERKIHDSYIFCKYDS